MSQLERSKRAWAHDYDGLSQSEIDQRVLGFGTMVRGIARDGSLSVEHFAELMGLEVEAASVLFGQLAAVGIQFDDSGSIVGAALTTQQTPHKLRIDGKDLYAWCALDTLFIPGLIDESAEVESTCPISGEAIRLSVSPQGLDACTPAGVALSIFLPGENARQTGPASPT